MKEGLDGRLGVTYVLVLSSVSTQGVSMTLPLLALSLSSKLPGCDCSSGQNIAIQRVLNVPVQSLEKASA